jgi:hypothetical protein
LAKLRFSVKPKCNPHASPPPIFYETFPVVATHRKTFTGGHVQEIHF